MYPDILLYRYHHMSPQGISRRTNCSHFTRRNGQAAQGIESRIASWRCLRRIELENRLSYGFGTWLRTFSTHHQRNSTPLQGTSGRTGGSDRRHSKDSNSFECMSSCLNLRSKSQDRKGRISEPEGWHRGPGTRDRSTRSCRWSHQRKDCC
jgi:hypothetical protein